MPVVSRSNANKSHDIFYTIVTTTVQTSMSTHRLTFLPENRTVSFTTEANVLDVALKNKIELSHSCGGMGSCTTMPSLC